MSRINRVCRIGLAVVGFGLVLCYFSPSHSSQWQTLGDHSVESGFGLSLRSFGNLTLLTGFTILAGGAWSWLSHKEEEVARQRMLAAKQSELLVPE